MTGKENTPRMIENGPSDAVKTGGGSDAHPSPVQLRKKESTAAEEPTARRVTFIGPGDASEHAGSAQHHPEAFMRKSWIEPPSTPDEQSLFYR